LITTNIQEVISSLNKNEVVAIPTETVYGLAANIYCEKAVKRIYELKKRPLNNPLIVHIKSYKALYEVAMNIPINAIRLAEFFWPGPLTLLLDKQSTIPDIVTSGSSKVAVRMPNHPQTLELLNQINFPLAAPSANPFGCISPTSAVHVEEYFGNEINYILDGGNCKHGIESTIIGFEKEQAILYRHGSIPIPEIEKVVKKIKLFTKNDNQPQAPGMLSKHYSPRTLTYLTDHVLDTIDSFPTKKIGLLLFQNKIEHTKVVSQEILSSKGNLHEAAKNLFASLHRLDKLDLDIIIAEVFPDHDLGKSINDRLCRASSNIYI